LRSPPLKAGDRRVNRGSEHLSGFRDRRAKDLIAAGTSLENPYVYDSVARELKSMANQGLVRITAESLASNAQEPLIERIRFERVR